MSNLPKWKLTYLEYMKQEPIKTHCRNRYLAAEKVDKLSFLGGGGPKYW